MVDLSKPLLTDLGEEKTITVSATTTYPSAFILSDDPHHIYLCWRGINWHSTIGCLTLPITFRLTGATLHRFARTTTFREAASSYSIDTFDKQSGTDENGGSYWWQRLVHNGMYNKGLVSVRTDTFNYTMDKRNIYWPIPNEDITANSNGVLSQNFGYPAMTRQLRNGKPGRTQWPMKTRYLTKVNHVLGMGLIYSSAKRLSREGQPSFVPFMRDATVKT